MGYWDGRERKGHIGEYLVYQNRKRSKIIMPLSDTQIFVALIIALFPGFLAMRLSLELYK